jgi:hypothetical protein
MKKTLTALLAAGAIGAMAIAAPAPAQARNHGGAVAAGVIGGLAVGAILGSAAAHAAPAPYPAYYAPAPGYVVYESYRAPYPVACPGGYWARRPVAFDYYGRPVAWSKPRFVCPEGY